MPTARLIDINTAAITYRTKVLMALDKRLYRNCIGGIISLNALLPEDDGDKQYRIVIDNEEHYKKIKASYVVVCPKCDNEFQYDSVQFYNVDLPAQDRIITGQKTQKIWVCKKCKKDIPLTSSKVIETVLQRPYYHRYVPDPPENTNGLISRFEFDKKMRDWVWLCLNSIEVGFTKFRDDNWNKKDQFFDMPELDTSIEEAS